jgi:hypothetical protein
MPIEFYEFVKKLTNSYKLKWILSEQTAPLVVEILIYIDKLH